MPRVSQQQALNRWDILPDRLHELIFSEVHYDILSVICEGEHLSEDKIQQVATLVGNVILGFIHPEDLAREIRNELSLNPQIANSIAEEVNRKIFAPVREDLDKFYSTIHFEHSASEDILDLRSKKPAAPAVEAEVSATPQTPVKTPVVPSPARFDGAGPVKPLPSTEAPKPSPAAASQPPAASKPPAAKPAEVKIMTPEGKPEEPKPFILHRAETEIKPVAPLTEKRSLSGFFSFLNPKLKKTAPEAVKAEVHLGEEMLKPKTKSPEAAPGQISETELKPRIVHYTGPKTAFSPEAAAPTVSPAKSVPPAPPSPLAPPAPPAPASISKPITSSISAIPPRSEVISKTAPVAPKPSEPPKPAVFPTQAVAPAHIPRPAPPIVKSEPPAPAVQPAPLLVSKKPVESKMEKSGDVPKIVPLSVKPEAGPSFGADAVKKPFSRDLKIGELERKVEDIKTPVSPVASAFKSEPAIAPKSPVAEIKPLTQIKPGAPLQTSEVKKPVLPAEPLIKKAEPEAVAAPSAPASPLKSEKPEKMEIKTESSEPPPHLVEKVASIISEGMKKSQVGMSPPTIEIKNIEIKSPETKINISKESREAARATLASIKAGPTIDVEKLRPYELKPEVKMPERPAPPKKPLSREDESSVVDLRTFEIKKKEQ